MDPRSGLIRRAMTSFNENVVLPSKAEGVPPQFVKPGDEVGADAQSWPNVKCPTDPEAKIALVRDILDKRGAQKVDGIFIDMQTANAIITVYDALNDKNKAKMASFHIARMGKIAWDLMGKQGKDEAMTGHTEEASDLYNFIMNTEPLHNQLGSIVHNLDRKKAKEVYDSKLAVKGMMYVVDDAARSYAREFGHTGARASGIFDRTVRTELAQMLVKEYEAGTLYDRYGEAENDGGFYVMGQHTSAAWFKTRPEAEAEAKRMNQRGGTNYTVEPAGKPGNAHTGVAPKTKKEVNVNKSEADTDEEVRALQKKLDILKKNGKDGSEEYMSVLYALRDATAARNKSLGIKVQNLRKEAVNIDMGPGHKGLYAKWSELSKEDKEDAKKVYSYDLKDTPWLTHEVFMYPVDDEGKLRHGNRYITHEDAQKAKENYETSEAPEENPTEVPAPDEDPMEPQADAPDASPSKFPFEPELPHTDEAAGNLWTPEQINKAKKIAAQFDGQWRSYSGRGMFGATCAGFTADKYSADEIDAAFEKAGIGGPSVDAMGKNDNIYYFRNLEVDAANIEDEPSDNDVDTEVCPTCGKPKDECKHEAKAEDSEGTWRPYGPGKFDSIVDSYVHAISMDGADDDVSFGEGEGWAGLMRWKKPGELLQAVEEIAKSEKDTLTAEEKEVLQDILGIIMSEDSQGFVNVSYFTAAETKKMLQHWKHLQDEAASSEDGESEEVKAETDDADELVPGGGIKLADMKAAQADAEEYYRKLNWTPDPEDLASAMADFLGDDYQDEYDVLYDAAFKFVGGKADGDETDGEDDEVEVPEPTGGGDIDLPMEGVARTETIMHGDDMATVRVGKGREFMRVQIELDEHDVRNLDVKKGYEERAKSILEGHNVNPVKPTFLRRFNAMVLNRDLLNVAKEA